MAKNSIEVEIKIPISKNNFQKVRGRIRKTAKLTSVSKEIDKYYNSPHRNFLSKKIPEEFLRVRVKNDASYLTYKHGYWNKEGGHTHSDEYETRIDGYKELEKILAVLNFENLLEISKVREIYRIKNTFEVCFDKVKGLGYFVEIESLEDLGGRERAMDALYEFARSLNLDPTKRDSKGYFTLMMEKRKLFGR